MEPSLSWQSTGQLSSPPEPLPSLRAELARHTPYTRPKPQSSVRPGFSGFSPPAGFLHFRVKWHSRQYGDFIQGFQAAGCGVSQIRGQSRHTGTGLDRTLTAPSATLQIILKVDLAHDALSRNLESSQTRCSANDQSTDN